EVVDMCAVADAANENRVPLTVHNTVAAPYLWNPIAHGAHTVVHSATKYLAGHGTVIAGVVVDSGTFDYGANPEKYHGFNEPDESYHGLKYAEALGPAAYITNLSV